MKRRVSIRPVALSATACHCVKSCFSKLARLISLFLAVLTAQLAVTNHQRIDGNTTFVVDDDRIHVELDNPWNIGDELRKPLY